MISKAHQNKAKSKRQALYLQNWASYLTFCEATWGENLYQARFSNFKILVSFLDLGQIFCEWAQFLDRSNFYIATWGLTQLLHWFLRGGDPLTGRVKKWQNTIRYFIGLDAYNFLHKHHICSSLCYFLGFVISFVKLKLFEKYQGYPISNGPLTEMIIAS